MEAKLIEQSIKEHFERNGTLDEMRSGLHVQVLKLLREQVNLKQDEPLCGGDMEQRGLLYLLNQLIIDYFHWYGYKHTLETFGLETGKKSKPKSRDKLQKELKCDFQNKELPILLQILMKETNKEFHQPNENKDKLQPIPIPTRPKQMKGLKRVQEPSPSAKFSKGTEISSKVEKVRGLSPSRKDVKTPQHKLNVRQRMLDETKPKEALRKRRLPKPIDPSECQRRNIQIYDSDLSPISTTSAEGSDAYADIPNRYYYREQEPLETAYLNDHGEEGPYEGSQLLKKKMPSNAQSSAKSKGLKAYEVENKTKSTMKSLNTKNKISERAPPKRSKFLTQRHVDQSGDEPDIPVFKPKCPETMVSTMTLNSDEDSEDDSDKDSEDDDYL